MLSPADLDLARRDEAVPGLATVLDAEAFVAAVRRAAPDADLRSARITYQRYKPQRFARVAYLADVGGAEVDLDVRACRPDDLARWVEDGRPARVPGPLGPGRIVLDDCAVVVTVFPNDLKLPALQHLADPVKRERALRELWPGCPNLWQGGLHRLRYRPERRYVAQLRAADGTQALLKAYTEKAYVRVTRNAHAFKSRGPLRIARVLGRSDHRRLLAFEWLPGRVLMEFCAAPETNGAAVSGAGAALATLHAQDPADLTEWTRDAEAADVVALGNEIGFICPQLARRADDLAQRLAVKLSAAPAMRCALHGDFSANQVLVGETEVAIIDLDWACCGDPADDLGNFLAQAERIALRGGMSSARLESVRAALLEGYARATGHPAPERVGLYTALEVFRRTRFPFRAREPEWAQRTEALLERAGELFNNVPQ